MPGAIGTRGTRSIRATGGPGLLDLLSRDGSEMTLDVVKLSRSFGGVFALRDVSLSVRQGELRGIIGPNGAGKSTLFNVISGHLAPTSGHVNYHGRSLQGVPPDRRARNGLAVVFQGARVFFNMTVVENVMVGAHAWTRHGFLSAATRSPLHWKEEGLIRDCALRALDSVGLTQWADVAVETLPIGQQRRLQVARALTSKPQLLLLDEPASGLRAGERADLAALIHRLHQQGLTIMLVEHDVPFVTRLADAITVLDLGQVIAEGDPGEVMRSKRVVTAYIGGEEDEAAGPVQ